MRTKFETRREPLYGPSLGRGKRYHYVVCLEGEQIASAETREKAEDRAVRILLGAYRSQNSNIYASITADGHVVTTREFAPGEVEFAHHRAADGRQGGSMISTLHLTGRPVDIAEFHAHYLQEYNDACAPFDLGQEIAAGEATK